MKGKARRATPSGHPGAWATDEDYPASAIRNGEDGIVGFRLTIGVDGSVKSCTVTQLSASEVLNEITCRLVSSRAVFTPARDRKGRAVEDSWSSRIKWVMPKANEPESTVLKMLRASDALSLTMEMDIDHSDTLEACRVTDPVKMSLPAESPVCAELFQELGSIAVARHKGAGAQDRTVKFHFAVEVTPRK
jgi:hypothetical protein